MMAQTVVPWVPLRAYAAWVARGVDWLAMTEDLPRPENRVTVDMAGSIRLHYRPDNVRAHRRLVREMRRILRRLGFWVVMTHSHGARNTTHQCGTACFGRHPATSVLDPFCRSHDVENLFVVDASFFPSSAAVNPGLTIAAQALRVADHIAENRSAGRSPLEEPAVRVRSFSHAGITVSDFNAAVRFYWDVFRCPLVGVADQPPERVRSFFGVGLDDPAPSCRVGWIRAPGGAVLEIFEFRPRQPPIDVPWNRIGLTHIAFNVRGTRPLARLSPGEGRRVRQRAGALPARAHVLLREGHRRQPDRADGPRLHAPRARLARPAGRLALPARKVPAVLRVTRPGPARARRWNAERGVDHLRANRVRVCKVRAPRRRTRSPRARCGLPRSGLGGTDAARRRPATILGGRQEGTTCRQQGRRW